MSDLRQIDSTTSGSQSVNWYAYSFPLIVFAAKMLCVVSRSAHEAVLVGVTSDRLHALFGAPAVAGEVRNECGMEEEWDPCSL